MISLEKWLILTPLQKLPKNVRDLGKLIVAKSFKKWPKFQKIAQSGHTDHKWSDGEEETLVPYLGMPARVYLYHNNLVLQKL